MDIEPGKTYRSRRRWSLGVATFPAGRLVAAAGRAANRRGVLVSKFQDVETGSCEWGGKALLIHDINLASCVEEVC